MDISQIVGLTLDANERLVLQQSIEIKTLAREVSERGEILRDILKTLDADPNDGEHVVLPEVLVKRIRKAVEE